VNTKPPRFHVNPLQSAARSPFITQPPPATNQEFFNMKLPHKEFLLDRMELSSAEYGKIPHATILQDSTDALKIVRAEGEYGKLFFQEIRFDHYSLWQQQHSVGNDLTLQTTLPVESLSLHFVLENPIKSSIQGLPTAKYIEGNHYNMFYVPQYRWQAQYKAGQTYTIFSIHFSPAYLHRWKEPFPFLSRLLERARRKAPAMIHEENMPITPDMMNVVQYIMGHDYEADGGVKLKKIGLQAKVLELLLLSLQHMAFIKQLPQNALREIDMQKIHDARAYLVENLEHPRSLNELAQHVGINVFKLKQGFKQVYGTTVFGILQEERMKRAQALLETTTMLIHEVALQTGYKNLSNFTAAFKKRFGYPPSSLKHN